MGLESLNSVVIGSSFLQTAGFGGGDPENINYGIISVVSGSAGTYILTLNGALPDFCHITIMPMENAASPHIWAILSSTHDLGNSVVVKFMKPDGTLEGRSYGFVVTIFQVT